MEVQELPNSFDDYLTESVGQTQEEKKTLDERFREKRDEWSLKIGKMSEKFKKIFDIQELMTNIYTERQLALEYYHGLISLLTKVNKEYRRQYAEKYDHYSFKGPLRFPNEKAKENKILSEMESIISNKEALNNHSSFMLSTIKTIDNIIYGMKYRIEIEQISRGK